MAMNVLKIKIPSYKLMQKGILKNYYIKLEI